MKKQILKLNSHSVLILLCLLTFILPLSVFGQSVNSIEQDPPAGSNSPQIETIDRGRLNPQRINRLNIPDDIQRVQLVTVPRLEGRPFNLDEIVTLLNRAGLQLGQAYPVVDSRIGIVLTQYPVARSRVAPKTKVNITYGIEEAPPEIVRVPNYVGSFIDEALSGMPNDRLTPGAQTEVNADEPVGIIVSQFPDAGMEVDPGTEINFNVSKGPVDVRIVRVPNLREMSLEQAARTLQELGLFVGNIETRITTLPEGIIVSQNPPAETEVLFGTAVDIFYSVLQSVENDFVLVPNLVNFTRSEAIRIIKENRLDYAIEYVKRKGQVPDVVFDQNPRRGTEVVPGMVVVIFVAEKEDVPPWLLWGGGVIIAGLAGGFIGRKINVKKKKPLAKDKDLIELKPVLDGGKQTLESDSKSLIQNKLHFKYISDTGTQTIKTE